ncbi:hypothetical protein HYH03_013185 [Edaphochlamys debaryana]|uniref:EGF-like domain-containing protein n=1 Tax=Edaphochlamys debaryana TaxID=47281 RepID=A0A835XQF2_9CHLO|nr:hypothetical protein HYH03_013185 [Edaphochlamys debaryana]|eukprot:KAG2488191.1 hypothetical protein HYH03_013185 [Edaphochlamys debaryana]
MGALRIVAGAVFVVFFCRGEAWSPFREETKTCHPECSRHGNCNGETGQCDCPFGLTGPTCTERLVPACHPSTNDSTTPSYGAEYPKNCACYKQLRALPGVCPDVGFEGPGRPDFAPCLVSSLLEQTLLCYHYTDRPEAEQLSDSPPLDHPGLEWRQIKPWREQKPYPTLVDEVLPRDQWPKEVKTTDGGVWRPLKECPDSCNFRGWCQVGGIDHQHHGHRPDEGPFCNCHGYHDGKSCEIADPYHCYRNCSGVGECVRGWCHCQPGYWGHGCTRRKAYTSSAGWLPNHANMKIYVYDLPENVVHRREWNDRWTLIDSIYLAEIEFIEQLLGDWSVRTENPWEASLFVIPTFTFWYTGNVGGPYLLMDHVSRYLQQTSPFWNATRGRNHVMFATNDQGVCKLEWASPLLQHSIKVVHYGLSTRRPYVHHANHSSNHSNPQGGEAKPLPGHRFEAFANFSAEAIDEEHRSCYRPEKDVVTPNFIDSRWLSMMNYKHTWLVTVLPDGSRVVNRQPDAPERNITFYFTGTNRAGLMEYSQGVRQAIHALFGPGGKHHANGSQPRPDYYVASASHTAVDDMQRAKFCLAPSGFGWGIRLINAMLAGCVPVIVQDHVYQAFWDVLPYEEFAIRISRPDLHRIVEILDLVTPEDLVQLQDGVAKWRSAFHWFKDMGGLAYNYTVLSLKRRALHLWSQDYRHLRHVHRLRS